MLTARELLDRTSLTELLTSLSGPPHGHGQRTRWPCFAPDHPDQHPSITMFVDRHGVERWRCWSDGRNGTAIDAVMIAHHLDTSAAMRWIAERYSDLPPAPRHPTTDMQRRELPTSARYWVNECEHRLWRPDGATGLAWLRRRGLEDAVLQANRIGYNPGRPSQQPTRLADVAGVTVCSFDRHSELIYVQLRRLDRDGRGKYKNPANVAGPQVAFPRGGPSGGPLVIAEGILDGLIVTQAGYRCAALTSTSSVPWANTSTIADEIATHAAGAPIVIALDGDRSGQAAAQRLRHQLGDTDVRLLQLPDRHDLTTLYRKQPEPCQHHSTNSPTPTASWPN